MKIRLPNGKLRDQQVCYEHERKFCSICTMFGHKTDACNVKNHVAEWSQAVHPVAKRNMAGNVQQTGQNSGRTQAGATGKTGLKQGTSQEKLRMTPHSLKGLGKLRGRVWLRDKGWRCNWPTMYLLQITTSKAATAE